MSLLNGISSFILYFGRMLLSSTAESYVMHLCFCNSDIMVLDRLTLTLYK